MCLITCCGEDLAEAAKVEFTGNFWSWVLPKPSLVHAGGRMPQNAAGSGLQWSWFSLHDTSPACRTGGMPPAQASPTHHRPCAGRAGAARRAGPAPATGCNPAATGKPGQAGCCRVPTSLLAPCFAPSTHWLCVGSRMVSCLPLRTRETMLPPHNTPTCVPPGCCLKNNPPYQTISLKEKKKKNHIRVGFVAFRS